MRAIAPKSAPISDVVRWISIAKSSELVRAVSVVVILVSSIALLGLLGWRVDATAERLHSLSSETSALLNQLESDRPVFVQAFISPTAPEQYVQTRANVIGLLREMASESGGKVQVAIYDTEPFTEEAREAREKFGIQPREIPNLQGARAGFSEVFLGLAGDVNAQFEL